MKIAAITSAFGVAILSAWQLRAQEPQSPDAACLSHMEQLGRALRLYQRDYDDKFPPADKWSDVLALYTKDPPSEKRPASEIPAFHCPSLGAGNWGYSMNWKLSKRTTNEVESPSTTVSIYETNVPRPNANYDGRDLIFRHAKPGANGPASGGNFAFADGSARWIAATQTPNFRIFLDNKPR